jgi:hypothetical protein
VAIYHRQDGEINEKIRENERAEDVEWKEEPAKVG